MLSFAGAGTMSLMGRIDLYDVWMKGAKPMIQYLAHHIFGDPRTPFNKFAGYLTMHTTIHRHDAKLVS
jgi:hypothetical protein